MFVNNFQRGVLKMFKPRHCHDLHQQDDFQKPEYMREHEMIKEIPLWWNGQQVEYYWILTATLCKKENMYGNIIQEFCRKENTAAPIESLGMKFLDFVAESKETLAGLVAQFEKALIKIKMGNEEEFIVDWNHFNPYQVFRYILCDSVFPYEQEGYNFYTVVSNHFRDLFRVVRVEVDSTLAITA
jgi:hypothetical protein